MQESNSWEQSLCEEFSSRGEVVERYTGGMIRRPVMNIVKRIVVFAALGAVVNVLVAWGCAVYCDPYNFVGEPVIASEDSDFPDYFVMIHEVRGATVVSIWGTAGSDWLRPPKAQSIESLLPSWADRRELFTFNSQVLNARGWPMLSMWSAMESPQIAKYSFKVHGGWEVPGMTGHQLGWMIVPRVIPRRVIWKGLVVNTFFYGVVLWVLFAVPFAIRRMIRRKRNLCPRCGYPVGVSEVCTECGREVKGNLTCGQRRDAL
ncbi:MAG TPA: hypothetical protein VG711_03775 [Phycisphaerales bacterium]|nr:hypothetical protein [Phycisphaerales bacterium]